MALIGPLGWSEFIILIIILAIVILIKRRQSKPNVPKVGMEDLKSKNWDQIKARVEFDPQIMRSSYVLPVFRATLSPAGGPELTARICIKCEGVFPLDPCPNCGYDGFVPGISTNGIPGIFCHKCEKGYSFWICPGCGTDNPVSKSLAKKKRGCFIATAVYESADSPQVNTLRLFRDDYLTYSRLGRILLELYYLVSPNLTRLINRSNHFKRIVREMLLNPIVNVIYWKYYSNKIYVKNKDQHTNINKTQE